VTSEGGRGWPRLLALGVALVAANEASFGLRFSSESQVLAWLPNGILVAFLLGEPARLGLGGAALALVLSVVSNVVMSGDRPGWGVAFSLVNLAEVGLIVGALRRHQREPWFASPARLGLLLLASAAAPAAVCLGGAGLLALRDPGRSFVGEAQKWFLGDAAGNLLALPLTLAWAYGPRGRWPRHPVDLALLVAGFAVASRAVMLFTPLEIRSVLGGSLVLWPMLIWAAVRLDERGLTLCLLVLAAGVCLQARLDEGLFTGDARRSTAAVISTQTFLLAASLSSLLLWASRERERKTAKKLLEMAQAEGELIERQRAIEWQLAASERGQAVLALTAGVAHDLRNAFGVLGLQGSMLSRKPDEQVAAAGQEIVETVEHSVAVLNSFVAMARQKPEDPAPFELRGSLELVASMVRPALPHEVTLDVRLGPEPGPTLVGVPTEIQQIAVNLLLNARDALEGRGRIELTLTEEGDEAVVRVRDEGRGIPEPIQAHIFEPFFTTKRPGVGTGLGLYAARIFAARHHGELTVESRPGHGATFTLRLPLSPPSQPR